jgi:hypothetical protein
MVAAVAAATGVTQIAILGKHGFPASQKKG